MQSTCDSAKSCSSWPSWGFLDPGLSWRGSPSASGGTEAWGQAWNLIKSHHDGRAWGCITHPTTLSTCKSFLWFRELCLCLSFLSSDACPLLLPFLSLPALLALAGWPGNKFCSWRRLRRSFSALGLPLLWKHREEQRVQVPRVLPLLLSLP